MNEMQPLKGPATQARPNIDYGIETLAVHAGARPDTVTGARSTPIYQTTSYAFDDADHAAELFNLQTFGYIYSRITNPTVAVLEERVAALENGRGAVAAATGHAAQFLVGATLLETGDEFISSNNLYGGSVTQFGVSFKKLGWTCHFVDMTEPENIEKAMTDKVKFIFCEGLANPAASCSISKGSPRSPIATACPSSSTTRWLRPISAGRSSTGPTSWFTRPPSSSAATATPWAGWSSNPAALTGGRTTSSRA